jgi:hypothetical protein
LAPLKAQVGLISDRYKPKHPADFLILFSRNRQIPGLATADR